MMTAAETRKLTQEAVDSKDSEVGKALHYTTMQIKIAADMGKREIVFPRIKDPVIRHHIHVKLDELGFRVWSAQTGINEETEYIGW